ncbi:MAG: hypothetical protein ACI9XZ_002915 [Alphaproteobacteria bacterium]|jgi:hypothetical protein
MHLDARTVDHELVRIASRPSCSGSAEEKMLNVHKAMAEPSAKVAAAKTHWRKAITVKTGTSHGSSVRDAAKLRGSKMVLQQKLPEEKTA